MNGIEVLNFEPITVNSFQGGCRNCGYGRPFNGRCPYCHVPVVNAFPYDPAPEEIQGRMHRAAQERRGIKITGTPTRRGAGSWSRRSRPEPELIDERGTLLRAINQHPTNHNFRLRYADLLSHYEGNRREANLHRAIGNELLAQHNHINDLHSRLGGEHDYRILRSLTQLEPNNIENHERLARLHEAGNLPENPQFAEHHRLIADALRRGGLFVTRETAPGIMQRHHYLFHVNNDRPAYSGWETRINGRMKLWTTRPWDFRIPIQTGGMYGRGSYITPDTQHRWMTEDILGPQKEAARQRALAERAARRAEREERARRRRGIYPGQLHFDFEGGGQ